MKKSKLFIPFGAFSACCAVATPLMVATSCSNSMRTFDLAEQKFTYAGGKTTLINAQTRAGATADYVSAIKNNPELFVQDYVNYLFTMDGGVQQTPDNWKQYKVSISLPTIGSTTVEYPGEGTVTYPTISFKMSIDAIYEDEVVEDVTLNEHDVGTIEYKNVPFFAYPDEETGEWRIGIKHVLGLTNNDNSYVKGTNIDYSYILEYMTDKFGINGTFDRTDTYSFNTIEGYKDIQKVHNDISINSWKDVQTLKQAGESYLTGTFMDFKSRYFDKLASTAEIVSTYATKYGEINVADDTNKVTITGLQLTRELNPLTESLPAMTIAKDYYLPFYDPVSGSSSTYQLHIGKGAKIEYEYPETCVGRMTYDEGGYRRDPELSLVIKSGTEEGSEVQVVSATTHKAVTLSKLPNREWNVQFPKLLSIQGETGDPFSVSTNSTSLYGHEIGAMTGPSAAATSATFAAWDSDPINGQWVMSYTGETVQGLYNWNIANATNLYNYASLSRSVFVDVTSPSGVITKGIAPIVINYNVGTNSFGIYFRDIYDLTTFITSEGNTRNSLKELISGTEGSWTITFSTEESSLYGMYSPYIWIADKAVNNHMFDISTSGWKLTLTVGK